MPGAENAILLRDIGTNRATNVCTTDGTDGKVSGTVRTGCHVTTRYEHRVHLRVVTHFASL